MHAETREGHLEGWTELTVSEFKAFLGTTVLMGVTLLPHLHCYWLWSTNYYLGVPHIQARSQKILLGGSFEGNVDLFLLQPFSRP